MKFGYNDLFNTIRIVLCFLIIILEIRNSVGHSRNILGCLHKKSQFCNLFVAVMNISITNALFVCCVYLLNVQWICHSNGKLVSQKQGKEFLTDA